jgi:hypothetical protein
MTRLFEEICAKIGPPNNINSLGASTYANEGIINLLHGQLSGVATGQISRWLHLKAGLGTLFRLDDFSVLAASAATVRHPDRLNYSQPTTCFTVFW